MYLTPCECKQAGWCERHQCRKTRGLFELCRRSQQYFDAFESGHVPGLLRKAGNLAEALAKHTADLGKKVTDEEAEGRLAVCRGCDLCDKETMQCLHFKCGCNLKIKATWKSQTCPQGLWPKPDEEMLDAATEIAET